MSLRTRTHLRRMIAVLAVVPLLTLSAVAASAAPPPRAPRGTTLSGVVLGPNAAPLAGAAVTAYALPGLGAGCAEIDGDLWAPVASTTTGSSGAYTLTVQPGAYRLGVVPKDLSAASFGYRVDATQVTSWVGWAGDVTVGSSGRSGVQVRLAAPRAITGHVYASEGYPEAEPRSTTPLGGMLVRAVAGSGSQTQRIAPQALTAPDGSYAIAGLPATAPDPVAATPENEALRFGLVVSDPAGWHNLVIWWHTMLGGPDNWFGFELPDADVSGGSVAGRDAWLYATGRITGVVSNAKGRPVPGVLIDYASAFPYPPVTADAKGRYVITAEAFDAAGAILRYRDPSGASREVWSGGVAWPDQAVPVPLPPVGGEAVANLRLPGSPATLTAALWHVGGAPAPGAQVAAYRPDRSDPNADWAAGMTTLTCDGRLTVKGLWPGAYVLRYGFEGSLQAAYVTLGAGEARDLGTLLLPSNVVRGQVVAEGTREPLAGIQVDLVLEIEGEAAPLADPLPGWWAGFRQARAVTDGNGQFVVFAPVQCAPVRFTDTDLGRGLATEFWQDQPDVYSAHNDCDPDPWTSGPTWGLDTYLEAALGTPPG